MPSTSLPSKCQFSLQVRRSLLGLHSRSASVSAISCRRRWDTSRKTAFADCAPSLEQEGVTRAHDGAQMLLQLMRQDVPQLSLGTSSPHIRAHPLSLGASFLSGAFKRNAAMRPRLMTRITPASSLKR